MYSFYDKDSVIFYPFYISDLYEEPIGPVRAIVPKKYHTLIQDDILNSYVSCSEKNSILFQKSNSDKAVIVHEKSENVYALLMENLSENGKEALTEINNPWLINTLVDWSPLFDNFMSSKHHTSKYYINLSTDVPLCLSC